MKTRWYITVETDARSMAEFDDKFFKTDGLEIPNRFIVGVVKEVKEEQ